MTQQCTYSLELLRTVFEELKNKLNEEKDLKTIIYVN